MLNIAKDKLPLYANISACEDSWISAGSGKSGIHYIFYIRKHSASVDFVLEGEKERNKQAFDTLYKSKNEIENTFGKPLEWNRCDNLKKSNIAFVIAGGYRSERETWKKTHELMIDAMRRMEKTFSPYVSQISVKY